MHGKPSISERRGTGNPEHISSHAARLPRPNPPTDGTISRRARVLPAMAPLSPFLVSPSQMSGTGAMPTEPVSSPRSRWTKTTSLMGWRFTVSSWEVRTCGNWATCWCDGGKKKEGKDGGRKEEKLSGRQGCTENWRAAPPQQSVESTATYRARDVKPLSG